MAGGTITSSVASSPAYAAPEIVSRRIHFIAVVHGREATASRVRLRFIFAGAWHQAVARAGLTTRTEQVPAWIKILAALSRPP